MAEKKITLFFNPFIRIAGWKALLWGLIGMVLAIMLSYVSGYHYHGLLHYGPAPNDTIVCYIIEHIVVWLIPAIIFLIGGLIFSKSHIRTIDVLGTVSFAQLPFVFMNLMALLPPMRKILEMDMDLPLNELAELFQQPVFMLGIGIAIAPTVFLVWVLIWMFNALKVSCNLKGHRLWILYLIGVLGGDALCRIIISQLY